MGWIVVTTEGEPARYHRREKDAPCPWTKEMAQQEADAANKQAEKLGIKTRYEIKAEEVKGEDT